MNSVISDFTTKAYRHIAKPAMFRISPDRIHNQMLRVGSVVQRVRPLRGLLHFSWAYDNPKRLGQVIHGIEFRNPVGLSAGLDKNFELPPLLKAVGFGYMEGGSLTMEPCKGNDRPWFHRLPKSKSLVVHAGLANIGVQAIIRRIKKYPARTFDGFPLNVSVAKTNSREASTEKKAIDDYIGSLRQLQRSQVGSMYTINISCPNTYGGEPFTSPDMLDRLLHRVDKLHLTRPVFIKMPNHLSWDEFDQLLAVADKHEIAGVTVSNLAKRTTQLDLADPLPDHIRGGLSGKPTWERSNELISRTRQRYGNRFTIIGVGGIFSAEDAYTKIKLGANMVELITGMIFEGPQLIGQINRGLVELLERDGYTNISEAVGADLKKPRKRQGRKRKGRKSK